MKKLLAALLCVIAVATSVSFAPVNEALAFDRNEDLIYEYSETVVPGKIRVIGQQFGNGNACAYFDSRYWKDGNGIQGCYLASTSMVLSYLGVDITPKKMFEIGMAKHNNPSQPSYNDMQWAPEKIAANLSTNCSLDTLEPELVASTVVRNNAGSTTRLLDECLQLFANGEMCFSPVIVHLPAEGHYIAVVSKIADGLYEVLDPMRFKSGQRNISDKQIDWIVQYKRAVGISESGGYASNDELPVPTPSTSTGNSYFDLYDGQVITLKNASSGWFMNIQHGSSSSKDGAQVNLYEWDGTNTEKYKVYLNSDGSFRLAPLCTPNKFVDIRRYSKPLAVGQGACIWGDDGDTHKNLCLRVVGDKVALVLNNNKDMCIAPASKQAAKTTQQQMIVRRLKASDTEILFTVCDENGKSIMDSKFRKMCSLLNSIAEDVMSRYPANDNINALYTTAKAKTRELVALGKPKNKSVFQTKFAEWESAYSDLYSALLVVAPREIYLNDVSKLIADYDFSMFYQE